jgi:MtrB/PioB family decaheme-associated outer membrane protein
MLFFDQSARRFDQELERERWSIALDKALGNGLTLNTAFSSEHKSGTDVMGAAIYIDASNGHAAALPRPVDQTTNTFNLGLALLRDKLSLELSYLYASFENEDSALRWQNPFDAGFGAVVDYPAGTGQIALEPDNSTHRLRLLGSYRISPTLRFNFDGSYAETTQDDSFLPYTVNNDLTVGEDPFRQDLNGEITTSTFNGAVYYRPLRKLTLQSKWRYEERDNNSPRDGYRYVRGDGTDQPGSAFTVYNTTHSRTVNSYEFEGSYRMPRHTRLSLNYTYQETERENAAVEETEDDIYTLTLSTRPMDYLSARLELTNSKRAASTYHWDQAYFALLDSEMINQIPDSQRFSNHPLLFQYHLANRDHRQAKVNLSYAPESPWSLSFDYLTSENDYTESALGLLDDETEHAALSLSILPENGIDLTAYISFDAYDNSQRGRAFRGGIEKNPFEIYAPLPQASDPQRDWVTESQDESMSVGVNLQWTMLGERLTAEVDLSLVDSTGEQAFTTFGAQDLNADALPNIENRQERVLISGTYHPKKRVAIKFEYQFLHYRDDHWALDDVFYNSMQRVLWTGETNADDDIHFFQTSIIYGLE